MEASYLSAWRGEEKRDIYAIARPARVLVLYVIVVLSCFSINADHDGSELYSTLRANTQEMQEKFANLLSTSHDRLSATNIPIDTFQVYITALATSMKENTTEQLLDPCTTSALADTFIFLTQIKCWDFLNFYLLECVVNKFGDNGLQKKVQDYTAEVTEFKRNTKVFDFLHIWDSHTPMAHLRVAVKTIESKWPHYTLADISHKQQYLPSEFLLEQFISRLAIASPGRVRVRVRVILCV